MNKTISLLFLAIGLMTASLDHLSAQQNPSAFEISKGISDSIGRAMERHEQKSKEREEREYWVRYNRDENAFIEELLLAANSVAEVDYAMIKIIAKVAPEKQRLPLAFLQDRKRELQNRDR